MASESEFIEKVPHVERDECLKELECDPPGKVPCCVPLRAVKAPWLLASHLVLDESAPNGVGAHGGDLGLLEPLSCFGARRERVLLEEAEELLGRLLVELGSAMGRVGVENASTIQREGGKLFQDLHVVVGRGVLG